MVRRRFAELSGIETEERFRGVPNDGLLERSDIGVRVRDTRGVHRLAPEKSSIEFPSR